MWQCPLRTGTPPRREHPNKGSEVRELPILFLLKAVENSSSSRRRNPSTSSGSSSSSSSSSSSKKKNQEDKMRSKCKSKGWGRRHASYSDPAADAGLFDGTVNPTTAAQTV